jgi:hypothetical protein
MKMRNMVELFAVGERQNPEEGSTLPCDIGVENGGTLSLAPSWRDALKKLELYVKKNPRSESANELYRQNYRCLSAKLVPTFADRRCHVVSVTDPYDRILHFLEQSRYFFFQVASQLYSRGWVDPFQTHYFSENLVEP